MYFKTYLRTALEVVLEVMLMGEGCSTALRGCEGTIRLHPAFLLH